MDYFNCFRVEDGALVHRIQASSGPSALNIWAGMIRYLYPGKRKAEIAALGSYRKVGRQSNGGRHRMYD